MANSTLFSAKNLSLEYAANEHSVQAIHPCDISIPEGKTTLIFGVSGSGKSSLLNVLSGLQKPTEGTLLYKNNDVYGQTPDELARFRAHELGIVYQTNYWVKSLSVIENVAMSLYFQGESKAVAHKSAQLALERVSMSKYANKYPVLLSGGEQQRIAMARALASNPPVIIADEPTGSLDSKNGDSIINLLQELQKDLKKTVILVTHNMEYLYIAEHLLEIQDGNVHQIKQSSISSTIKEMLDQAQKRILRLSNDRGERDE